MDPIVIVALVAAVASVIGSAVVALSARGKSKVDYKTALDARIDERVTRQLNEAWAQIDEQGAELKQLRNLDRITYRYVKQLRSHIVAGKGNPPPTIPVELVSWHNLND